MLGPLKRLRVLVVGGDKGVDPLAHLLRRGEAGAGQGPARQDRKPDLDLVEPRRMGRDEMKLNVWVARPPVIVFGLVGVEVVQDYVQFAVGILSDEAVHKVQKFDPPPAPIVTGFDQPGGDFEGGEQRGRTMPFIVVAEPR